MQRDQALLNNEGAPVIIRIGGNPWHQVKARKSVNCCLSGHKIKAGEHAWAPLGNGMNRMKRICQKCVDTAIKRQL